MQTNETKEQVEVKDNGINKEMLSKIVNEETIKAVKDNKLTKRALTNAFLELAEEFENLQKAVNSLYNVITTATGPFLANLFYDLNQNVKKEEKKLSKKRKNDIQ